MTARVVCTTTIAALIAASAPVLGQSAQLTISPPSLCPSARATGTSPDTTKTRPDTTGPTAPGGADSAALARSRGDRSDIVLFVGFSADELRFNSQPSATVRFCWGGDSLRVIERRNLPSPVLAGTTYRDVYIAAELRMHLDAECLSRALGVSTSGSTAATGGRATEGCTAFGLTLNRPPGASSTPPTSVPPPPR